MTAHSTAALVQRPAPDVLVSAYPALGIAYFVSHPSLWCMVIFHLCIAIALVLAGTIALFVSALPLQAQLLERVMAPGWAWTLAVFLCLVESVIITLLVGLVYLQAIVMDWIFDKVMIQQGHNQVVEGVNTNWSRGFYRFMHPILYLLTTLVCLPILLIPVVGQIAFVFVSRYFISWGCQLHYFDLKGMSWYP